jgi:hypothetical protein
MHAQYFLIISWNAFFCRMGLYESNLRFVATLNHSNWSLYFHSIQKGDSKLPQRQRRRGLLLGYCAFVFLCCLGLLVHSEDGTSLNVSKTARHTMSKVNRLQFNEISSTEWNIYILLINSKDYADSHSACQVFAIYETQILITF